MLLARLMHVMCTMCTVPTVSFERQSVHKLRAGLMTAHCRLHRQFGVVREPDAQLGLVAVQLGQLEDAKQLFVAANRPDLLNKLHQVSTSLL